MYSSVNCSREAARVCSPISAIHCVQLLPAIVCMTVYGHLVLEAARVCSLVSVFRAIVRTTVQAPNCVFRNHAMVGALGYPRLHARRFFGIPCQAHDGKSPQFGYPRSERWGGLLVIHARVRDGLKTVGTFIFGSAHN